jgi:hypothetical protein
VENLNETLGFSLAYYNITYFANLENVDDLYQGRFYLVEIDVYDGANSSVQIKLTVTTSTSDGHLQIILPLLFTRYNKTNENPINELRATMVLVSVTNTCISYWDRS